MFLIFLHHLAEAVSVPKKMWNWLMGTDDSRESQMEKDKLQKHILNIKSLEQDASHKTILNFFSVLCIASGVFLIAFWSGIGLNIYSDC